MKNQKLNYRFHNPNPADVTADYILKVFMEVNEKKVEQAVKTAADQLNYGAESEDGRDRMHEKSCLLAPYIIR